MTDRTSDPLGALGLLAEPVRRRLYEFVVAQPGPVDRDGAAQGVGIGRPLAAFHLDRLVAGGLLDTEYHRRSGRSGPGAGRPAKFYRRAVARDVEVSLPPRRYGLAAEILADGIDRSGAQAAVADVLESARATGARLASTIDAAISRREALLDVLETHGYEPQESADGSVQLRNCPFHALVERHRDLTCSMNLAFLESVAAGVPGVGLAAERRPAEGFCCVELVAAG